MVKSAVVLTTINAPNAAMLAIRDYAQKMGALCILIGDSKSPDNFQIDGADFWSVDKQKGLKFRFAQLCPTRHYARKNIGYLLAAEGGADLLIETDDDNIPVGGFEAKRLQVVEAEIIRAPGWANVYRVFSDSAIWPRGLPLTEVQRPAPVLEAAVRANCPIQQGLADMNPDVDAIYRLVFPLPQNFNKRPPVLLDRGVWCPFNSQNTTFFKEAFWLTYLPYYCSFRMTDIWRSFVAQRIMWECDWKLLFHDATVYQERNEHSLIKDFEDEIPGYLHNETIRKTLEDLELKSGYEHCAENILKCYRSLIQLGVIGQEEEPLLGAWLDDMSNCIS